MDMFLQVAGIVGIVVLVASIIAAVTPTPDDDNLLGKLYKIIDILALNIGKAKDVAVNKYRSYSGR